MTIGRPSSYKPEFAEQAKKLCEYGFTDKELAEFFGVSQQTIDNWKAAHPEFLGSLKSGKSVADERVERSLYHKAVGYTYDSEKVFQFQGQIVRTPVKEHVPPDTTAAIFWLKNRRSREWRDVHKHEHGQPGDFDSLNADQLRDLIARETEALGLGGPAAEAAGGDRGVRGKPN